MVMRVRCVCVRVCMLYAHVCVSVCRVSHVPTVLAREWWGGTEDGRRAQPSYKENSSVLIFQTALSLMRKSTIPKGRSRVDGPLNFSHFLK